MARSWIGSLLICPAEVIVLCWMVLLQIHLIWTLAVRRVPVWGLCFSYYMHPNCLISMIIIYQIHIVLLMIDILPVTTARNLGFYSLRSNDSIMLEFPRGKFYDHLAIALLVWLLRNFGMSFRRIFVTFHQLVFLKLLLKLIFLN